MNDDSRDNDTHHEDPRGYSAHARADHEVILDVDGVEVDSAPLRIGGTPPGPAHPSFSDFTAEREAKHSR